MTIDIQPASKEKFGITSEKTMIGASNDSKKNVKHLENEIKS